MILTILFGIIIQFLNVIFFIVSAGQKVVTIPLVDSYLVTGFGYWNAFLQEVPPLQVVWYLFLSYLVFEISLLVVKFFFGHRVNV